MVDGKQADDVQACSCSSVFMLLQACLGLETDGARKEVHVEQPLLPIDIESLRLGNVPAGDSCIDLDFDRVQQQVVVAPSRDTGNGVQVYVRI